MRFRAQGLRAFASAGGIEEGSGDLAEFIDLFEGGGVLVWVFYLLWGREGGGNLY